MNREEHLYVIAAEEGVEVAQRCTKAARFGSLEIQPGQALDNRDRILQEFADLVGVLEMLGFDVGIPEHAKLRPWIEAKKQKVEHFLAYSREVGTLTDRADTDARSCFMPDSLTINMNERWADCGLCGAETLFHWGVPTYNGDVVSNDFPDDLGGGSIAACEACFHKHERGEIETFDHYYVRPGPMGVCLVNGAGI